MVPFVPTNTHSDQLAISTSLTLEQRRHAVKQRILVDCYEHYAPAIPDVVSLVSSHRDVQQTRRVCGRPCVANSSDVSTIAGATKERSGKCFIL